MAGGGEDRTGSETVGFARRHSATILLGAIIVAAALLRFLTLGDQSLDHDETVTAARVLHDSLFHTMGVVMRGERSPPLYYFLIWVWSRAWGTGAFALRSLSAIFGTATVVFAYLAGRELASRRAGLIAAVLVGLNPYLIWYSQEARSYGALVLLGAVALYFFARARRSPTRGALIGWGVACSLALLTHYFALFFVVPEAILLLASSGRGRRRATLAAIVGVATVGVALVPLALAQEGTGRGNGFTQYPVAERAETALVKYVSVEGAAPQAGILSTSPLQRQLGLAALGVLALALLVVATRGSPGERRGAGAAATIAIVAFAVPLVLAWLGFDFVDPRNLIGAVVPALVGLAIAFGVRGSSLGGVGLVACCALFGVAFQAELTTPALQRHDWRAAAAALPSRPAAALIVAPQDARTPLEYYTGCRLEKFLPPHFAGGVATRRIVVLSDYPPVRRPDPRFRLTRTRVAPQHWTIDVYASRRPVVVAAGSLAGEPITPEPSTLLARGRPILLAAEARADTRAAATLRRGS